MKSNERQLVKGYPLGNRKAISISEMATVRRAACSRIIVWSPHSLGSNTPKTAGPSNTPASRATSGTERKLRFIGAENRPTVKTTTPTVNKAMFKVLISCFVLPTQCFYKRERMIIRENTARLLQVMCKVSAKRASTPIKYPTLAGALLQLRTRCAAGFTTGRPSRSRSGEWVLHRFHATDALYTNIREHMEEGPKGPVWVLSIRGPGTSSRSRRGAARFYLLT